MKVNGGQFFMLARLPRRMKKDLMFGSLEMSLQKLLDELICLRLICMQI